MEEISPSSFLSPNIPLLSIHAGMAWISGMATVIGGVSSDEFLQSIEFLDNSAEDDAVLGMDWRIAAHALSRPRYDFTVAAVPVSAMPSNERSMHMCFDDEEVVEGFVR